MFILSNQQRYLRLCIWIALFGISSAIRNLTSTSRPVIICPYSQLLCGESTCYDPFTQRCTNPEETPECIGTCGNSCYNPDTHKCFNSIICGWSEQLCTIKHSMQSSTMNGSTAHACYNPEYQACFNDTLCSRSQLCGEQCLQQGQACTSNKTICNLRNKESYFVNFIAYQSCNDICYDPKLEQCIDGTIQCINNNNCSGTCYDSSMRKCLNGTLCSMSQDLCYVKYSERGQLNTLPSNQCYDPSYQTCFNNTLCRSYQLCSGQCLQRGQLCINNQTICSSRDTMLSYNYWSTLTVYDSCNGICYDLTLEQCIDGNIQCINNNNCSGTCYNSSTHKCFNRTLCQVDEDFCNVKSGGSDVENYPHLVCYNPNYQLCLNNTLCTQSQVCGELCLGENELCMTNKSVCIYSNKEWHYNNTSQSTTIKSCSGICYDPLTHNCLNGTLCGLDEVLCFVQNSSWSMQFDSQLRCYNPKVQVCLDNTPCYQFEVCGQRCLRTDQLCINRNTTCNSSLFYRHTEASQIEACNGMCYNTPVQLCIDGKVVNKSNVSPIVLKTTTVAFVSSDYQSLWWDIFKINCYIMVVVAVAFFITRRLAVWPWTKIEKSIYLDPEQISLIKSDQI